MIRNVATSAIQTSAFERFLDWMERGNNRTDVLRILTYHRVDWPERVPHLSPPLNSATPDGFEQQMQFLAERYQVVSAQAVAEYFERGVPLPPRAVMVTFDDAYADFKEHAWPVMKRLGLPIALFVPTAFPDHPERAFWWDKLYAALAQTTLEHVDTPFMPHLPVATAGQRKRVYKQLRNYARSLPHDTMLAWVDDFCAHLGAAVPAPNPVLGWDDLRDLARDGVSLGAHTRTHPLLNRVTPDVAREEIVGSLRDLQEQVGIDIRMLAYPGGGIDDDVVTIMRQEGFNLAFTTVRGANHLRTADRLRLSRFNVGYLAPLATIRVQLLGWTIQPG